MENSGFQSQLLAVVEVLAKAAVAEINRSVEDSCAVLRLEVSQGRRDIDLLKRKCEGMEAELRRTRMRARRKAFYPPAAERFSPLVKVVLNKESQSTGGGAEAQHQHQQCADVEPVTEAQRLLIKEEREEEEEEDEEEEEEEDDSRDKLISGAEQQQQHGAAEAEDFGPLVCPSDPYHAFPWPPLDAHPGQPELAVKREGPDHGEAPLDPAPGFLTEEADRPPWLSDQSGGAVDSGAFSCGEHRFEPIPFAFPPPPTLSAGKSHSASMSAARAKRRARALGFKRSQPDGGHGAFSRVNAAAQCSAPQQSTLQCEDAPPASSSSSSFFCGHSRAGFGLARRMWRSGLGEKRFSCTYCDKRFVRFSQLKEHLRSHTGEKPFSCLQCGRSFTKQCNLIRHAVVHSGEKPYECALCGKCFTQRSSLKSHQKTAH
ncbi:zinc finger protein 853 [Pungitius pungitius]|uniref:zinc finger protein 853 n=1 Tax=Pungitius pungitius TaxID=134920 RepID=UPI002E14D12C